MKSHESVRGMVDVVRQIFHGDAKRFATHTILKPSECNCGIKYCNICDGGLAYCTVCFGGERELYEASCSQRCQERAAKAAKDAAKEIKRLRAAESAGDPPCKP